MNGNFFDVHCHLFNLVDVPLWETFSGAMKMHTLIGLAAILKGPQIAEEQRYFIRFFERSSETNLLWLHNQINNAIRGDQALGEWLGAPSRIILTPLIMDFDTSIVPLPEMQGDETVESQYERLHRAIVDCKNELTSAPTQMRVFPFMGFSLNKLNANDPNNFLARLKDWWRKNGMSREERKLPWESMPQKAIGIKLYPALGFVPYLSLQDRSKYCEFYHWCIENDIPLTVHCQQGAFNPQRPGEDDLNSSPHYWLKVLETEGLQGLRINFAHFGGSRAITQLFNEYGNCNTGSDTYKIMRMLLDYPNTYADLAAINFADKDVCKAFSSLLTKDLHGSFSLKRSLCDKLMWGSDVPMVLESPQYRQGHDGLKPRMGYINCLRHFTRCLSGVLSIVSGQDNQYSQRKQMEIMQQLVDSNPERFLRPLT